jgi:hypothetical protein
VAEAEKNLRCGGNQTINHWEQCSRPCSTEDYFSQQRDKFQNLKQKFSSQIPCIMYWVFFFDAISAQSAERSCRSRIEDSSRRPAAAVLVPAGCCALAPCHTAGFPRHDRECRSVSESAAGWCFISAHIYT